PEDRPREHCPVQSGVQIHLLVAARAHEAPLQRANPVSCRLRKRCTGENPCMRQTVLRVALAALVVVGIVVGVLALWKLKVLIALLFLAFIVSAARRPRGGGGGGGGPPRGAGIVLHSLAVAGLVALLLWLVVPRAVSQVESAVG